MKYSVNIRVVLKEGVLDPQGETINNALINLGFGTVRRASTGKLYKLDIEAETEAGARKVASEAAMKLLANPVIERYEVEVAK